MAPERRPHVISVSLELEDNCGSIITKRKKTIQVKLREDEDDGLTIPPVAVIEEAFQEFVDALPETFEV